MRNEKKPQYRDIAMTDPEFDPLERDLENYRLHIRTQADGLHSQYNLPLVYP
jgi:hypothetical protein